MPRTVLTSKGQMTVPQQVRASLGLEMGDQLLIETNETGFQATVIRRPKAAELQGILNDTVKYEGKEAEERAVAEALTQKQRLVKQRP